MKEKSKYELYADYGIFPPENGNRTMIKYHPWCNDPIIPNDLKHLNLKDYDEINELSENRAPVRKGRFWGYINSDLELVIPLIYSRAYCFINGRALVKLNDVRKFIDYNGNEIKGI